MCHDPHRYDNLITGYGVQSRDDTQCKHHWGNWVHMATAVYFGANRVGPILHRGMETNLFPQEDRLQPQGGGHTL